MSKKEPNKCTNLRDVMRRFIQRVKATECGKRIASKCQKPNIEGMYNIPLSFLNAYDIGEEEKLKTLEMLASMPKNYTQDQCSSESTECSEESETEPTNESPSDSSTSASTDDDGSKE